MYYRLVAMNVTDPVGYQMYRDAMTPLLHAAGGRFSYDFEVARTLQSEAAHPINRVFLISFPSREASAQFFADPVYLKIRAEFFDLSVDRATTVGVFED